MRRRALLVGLITGLAALAACSQIAGAQAVERIRISDPARQGHELPPGLLVELASPASTTGSPSRESGRWAGPRYEERGNPGNAGLASLNWSVTFDQRQGDAEAVSLANVSHTTGRVTSAEVSPFRISSATATSARSSATT